MIIYKYPLQMAEHQFVGMPAGAQVLTAQVQDGHLQLWVLVSKKEAPFESRCFVIRTTGIEFHSTDDKYIATFQLHQGAFVGHVFEMLDRK